MNVNGQWSMNGNINFNMPLDSMQRWNFSTVSSCSYNENTNFNSTPLTNKKLRKLNITSLQDIAFEDIDALKDSARINHTSSVRLHQSLGLRFRNKGFSWRIGGDISYYKIRNSVKNGLSRETFDYTVSANFQAELPLNMQVSTTANFNSRHGYSSSIQKNICVWNAQLSKRLFKHNAGVLSFQIFDILHQRTNIVRTINALSISDTKQLMLKNYFLLSFQYNFNTLRNKRHMARNNNQRNQQNNRNGINNRNNRNNRTGNNMRGNFQNRMGNWR